MRPPAQRTTTAAYHAFLQQNGLAFGMTPPSPLERLIDAYRQGNLPLEKTGSEIRQLIREAVLTDALVDQIRAVYRELSKQGGTEAAAIAVAAAPPPKAYPEPALADSRKRSSA